MDVVEGLHVEWVEEEAVVLDTVRGVMHYLNPPAAYVYALIQEYGYHEAMTRLENGFDESAGIRRNLRSLLDEMVSKGLLTHPAAGEPD